MSSTRPDLKFSDNLEERKYYNRFGQLPPKNLNTIRVTDHNNKDYFTVLDEDAELIADNIFKTQSIIKYNQANKNKYVTIAPPVFLNNVLKFCLIDNNYKVEIYDHKTFRLIAMGTPGNLEKISNEYGVDLENMVPDASSPITAAIKFQQLGSCKKVGVCLVDLSSTLIQVSEFDDNDLFSNLESLLIQLGVKEVILPSNYDPENKETPDVIKLYQTLDKVGIVMSTIKSSFFSSKDIDQDLIKILSKEDTNVELILGAKGINSHDYQISFSCCNALINYLELLTENEFNESQTFSIEKYNLTSYMKLDSSTLNALNIFPTKQTNNLTIKSNQISSIFELLNKCKTTSGSRLLSQWLKQPLTDLKLISERQRLVEKLLNDTNLRIFINQEFLPQVPDIKRILKKINNNLKRSGNENKKLEDIVRLYQLFLVLPNLIEILQLSIEDESESIKTLVSSVWLNPIKECHAKLAQFQGLVETAIDLSPLDSLTVNDLNSDFNVNPNFEQSLQDVNERLQEKEREIKLQHETVAEDLNIDIDKKLKLEKHQIHNWCFRVTRNDSVVLRGTNYKELQTVKAGVYFTNQELSQLSKEHGNILQEYNNRQKEIIQEILLVTLTFESIFTDLSISLSNIDVLIAFANTAILSSIQYVKPKLTPLSKEVNDDAFNSRKISLKNSRHPILEVQDDLNFIPNDVDLNNQEQNFAIITGPNMGGKSTYIRQIGVIALMSQIGSFIPCDETNVELPIFDSILSRVGAGDSQLKGLSTFMIEMLETSSILSNSTHNSLIIIDELGRGTSTYDGFGLAYSILEYIINQKQCFTLFATHFHELTELGNKYVKIQNLQVKALINNNGEGGNEGDDLTLIYKVEPGISSKSFGINVAELVRFPEKIINMAKRKASELQEENNEDDYIQVKKTKCSGDEINNGIDNLNKCLKQWKLECFKDNELLYEPDETIQRLKQIAESQQDDKFLSELVSVL